MSMMGVWVPIPISQRFCRLVFDMLSKTQVNEL